MVAHIDRDPSMPIKRIYDRALLEDHDVEDDEIPTFDSVRSKLTRKRLSLIPHIPHEMHDVLIEDEYLNTWRDEPVLSHQDNDWGIAVFVTEANLRKLQRCSNVYVDGTFKTCPHPYVQFVTIHGMFQGRVLPFVMSLLTGKTVGHYRQLLQHANVRVRQLTGHHFRPWRIISDFEISLLLIIETELPRSKHVAEDSRAWFGWPICSSEKTSQVSTEMYGIRVSATRPGPAEL